ncbi:Protein fuzzy [Nymphon striatum]|nr:Protein fuzzy [Nymphon striatum]
MEAQFNIEKDNQTMLHGNEPIESQNEDQVNNIEENIYVSSLIRFGADWWSISLQSNLKKLTLSTVGVLNGLDMFGSSCGFKLLETRSCDARIIWKDFENSIRFVLITSDDGNSSNSTHFHRILDHVYNILVIFLGEDHLKNINSEKKNKDLQVCFHVIDSILEQLNQDLGLLGDLTGCTDCIVSPDNPSLKSYLETFVNTVDTCYGCILVRGKVAVATQSWWTQLKADERMLLSLCISALAKCGASELLIYLPHSSPKVPKFWRDAYVNLKSLFNLQPRNFPQHWILDKNIIGFLLIDQTSMKCLVSYQPTSSASSDVDSRKDPVAKTCLTSFRKRQEILRSFYKHVTETIWEPLKTSEDTTQEGKLFLHNCPEVYLCLDHHKCYAIHLEKKQLFIISTSKIPNYALRSISHKAMNVLTGDKHIHL